VLSTLAFQACASSPIVGLNDNTFGHHLLLQEEHLIRSDSVVEALQEQIALVVGWVSRGMQAHRTGRPFPDLYIAVPHGIELVVAKEKAGQQWTQLAEQCWVCKCSGSCAPVCALGRPSSMQSLEHE